MHIDVHPRAGSAKSRGALRPIQYAEPVRQDQWIVVTHNPLSSVVVHDIRQPPQALEQGGERFIGNN